MVDRAVANEKIHFKWNAVVEQINAEVTTSKDSNTEYREGLDNVRKEMSKQLEKIRTESRMLHPVVLDDFGLEKALAWYVEQFGRQHGIDAKFQKSGPVGLIPPDSVTTPGVLVNYIIRREAL